MDFLEAIGKPAEYAEYIVAILVLLGFIWAGIKFIPGGYRWVRSWTFVKREELKRFKEMEPRYEKCEADLKTLTAFCAPYKEQLERELDKRYGKLELSPNDKGQEFTWNGFLWLLKKPFWSNYDHLSANQAGDQFLETAIHRPLRIECKRDLGTTIKDGRSVCSCARKFELPDFFHKPYPAEILRRKAYAEAQAAVRRNELQSS
jgi:hypothetical protein